jgi:hypothetical protein
MKRKWIYIVIFLASFIPAYTRLPIDSQESYKVVAEVLAKPIIYRFTYLFPIAKLILILYFICPILWKNKFSKIYSIMAVILLSTVIIFQNMSNDTSYVFTILIGNVIAQMVIVILFLWEIKVNKNDFSEYNISPINIVTFILGFLAFWMPSKDGIMYFSVKDILFNEAGLTFCMIIPIIITSLLMYYKTVNITLLKIMSFIGIYYGLLNQMTWFVLNPVYWWMGILHLPLLINSIIGFIIAIKEEKRYKKQKTIA